MRGLIEILSSATEFEQLAIRHKEDTLLEKLAIHLPVKINKPDYNKPSTKVNVLLQTHFSRKVLPIDLVEDQNLVLKTTPRLLQAMVDVISSNGWLSPALSAMELSQMVVQAMWDGDSQLKQLPYFTQELVDRIKKAEPEVESILDLLEMDDEKRDKLLQMDKAQLVEVAKAANRYPNISLTYKLDSKEVLAGAAVKLAVELTREMDEDEKLGPVHAPFYPGEKAEGWWLVVGNTKTNKLLAIKKISFTNKPLVSATLEFEAPQEESQCFLYFMSDSYLGCDQEWDLEMQIKMDTTEQ